MLRARMVKILLQQYRHKADMPGALSHVCFRVESRHGSKMVSCPLLADFVAELAEEESGRWRRAKLSLPLARESGGGDYSTDSNATLA